MIHALLAAVAELLPQVDELVCLCTPEFFGAVGEHCADFRQVQDEEVIAALAGAAGSAAQAGAAPAPCSGKESHGHASSH